MIKLKDEVAYDNEIERSLTQVRVTGYAFRVRDSIPPKIWKKLLETSVDTTIEVMRPLSATDQGSGTDWSMLD